MVSLRKQTPCLSLTHGDSDSACFLVFLRREDRFINNGASYLFQLDTIPGCQTPNAGSLSQKHTISPPLSSFPLSTQDGWCLWMHTFIYPWCNFLQKKNKNCPPPPSKVRWLFKASDWWMNSITHQAGSTSRSNSLRFRGILYRLTLQPQ